ncbi:hypothetical protein CDAR_271221 [Caerostris darwini]|uniref:Uncharacterized protein n=1 Tax=Caerostris darwini TaxID=1538125 RepID=A0AAV4TDW3_9ARAC|nr:hypothetical protein CDAR_271221 [Caerostris darwini]
MDKAVYTFSRTLDENKSHGLNEACSKDLFSRTFPLFNPAAGSKLGVAHRIDSPLRWTYPSRVSLPITVTVNFVFDPAYLL